MITENQIITRVLIAAALGMIIGFERERQNHAAGLRTHMVLAIGAALAMTLSINLAIQYHALAPNGDPARLAAQVVSGIGFLGAGIIFRFGNSVRGLTTAASLWTIAVIGLAVGAGFILPASIITVLLLIVLSIMNYVEDRFIAKYDRLHIVIWADYRPGLVEEIKKLLNWRKRDIGAIGLERNMQTGEVTLELNVRVWEYDYIETVIATLGEVEGLKRIKISE